jgi:signal transduction histidine kinase
MAITGVEGGIVNDPPHRDELQRTIELLRSENDELRAAVGARDAFLAMAAHELRNPMTPIVGQVARLHRSVAMRACSLDDVEHGLQRIQWLIDLYLKRATTLLDVSRITSGKLRLEPASVDIAELLRIIAASLEPAAQYAGSTLTLQVAERLPAVMDPLAIEQILDNLLLNAIKYGAGRPIDITAALEGELLRLSVRDRGIGMSQEDQRRIFEPFERAISYGVRAGFGIGLWVVRQLVDAMQGEIHVHSAPDAGTTFTVTLPAMGQQS